MRIWGWHMIDFVLQNHAGIAPGARKNNYNGNLKEAPEQVRGDRSAYQARNGECTDA